MKKNQRHKNLCQHGTNYFSAKFCPTWAEFSKTHFCPGWTEVKTPTSTQVVSNSKITSTQLAEKSVCNFYSGCVEVKFAA